MNRLFQTEIKSEDILLDLSDFNVLSDLYEAIRSQRGNSKLGEAFEHLLNS
ncbi:MAG: hypothetical protein FWD31_10790 [Planctomycetaceae bacterium]|nr:hypothetical protein [Planctomycetaceae bacterium]